MQKRTPRVAVEHQFLWIYKNLSEIYLSIYLSLPVKAEEINTANQIRLLISTLTLYNSIVLKSFCEFLNSIDPFPIKFLLNRLSFY